MAKTSRISRSLSWTQIIRTTTMFCRDTTTAFKIKSYTYLGELLKGITVKRHKIKRHDIKRHIVKRHKANRHTRHDMPFNIRDTTSQPFLLNNFCRQFKTAKVRNKLACLNPAFLKCKCPHFTRKKGTNRL